MKTAELIEGIAAEHPNLPTPQVRKIIESALRLIAETAVAGDEVALVGFCQSSRLQVVAGARPDGGMRSGVRKQAEDFDSTAELAQPPSISADLLIMPGTNA